MSTEHQHQYLHPSVLKDASTGTAGLIAGELAAEEASLLGRSQDAESASYGAAGNKGPEESNNDENDGYALPKAQLNLVVMALSMCAYLAALDVTIVSTLLTLIASDLNEVKNISWIATSYLLSSAALQPLFGKLSDIFGRKPLLIMCCFLFGIGCIICSTDSLKWLIIGRFITGCGGSGLTSLGTITMSDLIPLRERGYYQGLANICFGLGTASGGLLGGIVADLLGWKWVFILQVPLTIIVGLAIYINLNLPEGSPGLGSLGNIKEKLKRVDFLGAFTLVSALMAVMLAASLGGRQIAFSSKTFIGLCIGALILLLAFIYVESYVSEEPIIPVELLTIRTVLASSLANWFYTMGVFAYLFYVPVYFTSVMNLTATQNGIRLVPNFFGVSIGSIGAGLYMRKTGRYYILTICAGLLSVIGAARITYLSPTTSVLNQYTLLVPPGLGYACMLTVTLLALIASVPSKYQARTTSIQYTFRSTGSTIGVSIASALFQQGLKRTLNYKIHDLIPDATEAAKIINRALENSNYSKEAPKIVQEAIKESYAAGCKGAFYFSFATILIGYISSLFMREHKLHTSIDRD
jgi:EmrB/QacA subfamily drug resistance transporter